MKDQYFDVTPQDIRAGVACISNFDNNVAPNLVDADGSPARLDAVERRLAISLAMLALSPDFDPEKGEVTANYQELSFLCQAIERYEETKNPIIIGGCVRLIRDRKLAYAVEYVNEKEAKKK